MLQVEAELSPAVELDVALNQIGFEQGHAAANVAADHVRVDHSLHHKGSADWAPFAWVQIREANRQAHAFKLCRRIELAECLAFDPAFGRGEKAHLGLNQSIHAFLSSLVNRDWGFSGAGSSVRNSAFRTPRVNGPRGW